MKLSRLDKFRLVTIIKASLVLEFDHRFVWRFFGSATHFVQTNANGFLFGFYNGNSFGFEITLLLLFFNSGLDQRIIFLNVG